MTQYLTASHSSWSLKNTELATLNVFAFIQSLKLVNLSLFTKNITNLGQDILDSIDQYVMVAIFIWRKSTMIWSLKVCVYNDNVKGHLPWSFTGGMALWDKSVPTSILLWLKKSILSSYKAKIFVTIGKSYSFKCLSFLSYPFPSVLFWEKIWGWYDKIWLKKDISL